MGGDKNLQIRFSWTDCLQTPTHTPTTRKNRRYSSPLMNIFRDNMCSCIAAAVSKSFSRRATAMYMNKIKIDLRGGGGALVNQA